MNVRGARRAITQATSIGWNIPELGAPRGGVSPSNLGRICSLLEASTVLNAVDAQKGAVSAWLYFAYACASRSTDRETVHAHIMKTVFCKGARWHKPNDLGRPSRMIDLCMEDYKRRVMSRGERKLLIKDMALALSVDPCNWGRDWAGKFSAAQDILAALDKKGITGVSEMIDCLRWPD